MEESFVPMEELIKSGEVSGRSALEYLSKTGQYTFHGSPYEIETLEPRQAYSNTQPDGEPAVATTPNVDSAIFRALINRKKDEEQGRKHHSAWSGTAAGMNYVTLKSSLDALSPEEKGYVYVFGKANHDFLSWRGELRSLQPLDPDLTVEVHPVDLPEIIAFETEIDLLDYLKTLRNP
jgi:hypothetical protein